MATSSSAIDDEMMQTSEGGGTQTCGGGSTQTCGGGNTQTCGGGSTQTCGGGSTQTCDGGSTQTRDGGSTQTCGGGSTQTCGRGSTQTCGGGSTQTCDGGGTQTCEHGVIDLHAVCGGVLGPANTHSRLYKLVSPGRTIDCQHSLCCEESSTDGLHISALPSEIFYLIMRKFRHDELCKYVAPVCKYWYKVTYDPVLWTNISFRDKPKISHDESAFGLLANAPLVRALDLNGLPVLALATLPTVVQYCPSLRSLDLGFCNIVDRDVLQLIVFGCKQLVHLNIEGCPRVDHSSIEVLIMLPRLKSVNLSHCTQVMDNSIVALASGLTELTNLNIDGIVWIQRSAIECLSNKCSATLHRLDLDGAELEDDSIKLLSQCTNLVRLSLSFAELLTDACLVYLTNLHKLEELRLRKGCQLSSHGLYRMLSQTIPGQNLRSLDLTECTMLDDDGVVALSKNCVKLSSLSLAWCWHISDRGLAAIVDYCHQLEFLDLLGIHAITGVCLDRIPDTMPRLKHMDLQNCNEIIDDLVVDLIRRQPNLTIINYYGEDFTWRDMSAH